MIYQFAMRWGEEREDNEKKRREWVIAGLYMTRRLLLRWMDVYMYVIPRAVFGMVWFPIVSPLLVF